MNETRIYADAFETTFANTKEMLEFLAERAKASDGSVSRPGCAAGSP